MSDSSLSDGLPSDATLEQALRDAVQQVYKRGNLEDLTVKRIRKSAEGELDLPDDFFKNDATWKGKSKTMIQLEVDAQPQAEAASSQPTPKKSHPPSAKPQEQHHKAKGTKRASNKNAGPRKRRKKEDSEEEDPASEGEPSEKKSVAKAKPNKRSPSPSVSPAPEADKADWVPHGLNGDFEPCGLKAAQSDSDMSELVDEIPKPKRSRKSGSGETKTRKSGPPKSNEPSEQLEDRNTTKAELSESEMSVLIDEAPKPNRSRKSGSAEPKAKKTKGSKAKKPSEEPVDPNVEEIKRLQGWLVKCGIRKMWYKELAPYDTSKGKIRHLKEMLTEAGMTGRFSETKAEQIKEERELRADLEAVQEGDKKWGQGKAEEYPNTGRPKRELAKGFEGLDFLNDDDGEETD